MTNLLIYYNFSRYTTFGCFSNMLMVWELHCHNVCLCRTSLHSISWWTLCGWVGSAIQRIKIPLYLQELIWTVGELRIFIHLKVFSQKKNCFTVNLIFYIMTEVNALNTWNTMWPKHDCCVTIQCIKMVQVYNRNTQTTLMAHKQVNTLNYLSFIH